MKKTTNKDIEKLEKLIKENLGRSRNEIQNIFGMPSKKSDNEVWSYKEFRLTFYNNEIFFLFENDMVTDICIYKYFLWIEIKNIFYMEYQNPEYKEVHLL